MNQLPTKEFPTLHVASCLTGVCLAEGMTYSTIMGVASHLFGASIWTHELIHGPTQDAYVEEGYRQFPQMPTKAEAKKDWQAAATKAVSAYGNTVTVSAGWHGRRENPFDTLSAMVPKEKIMVINVDDQP